HRENREPLLLQRSEAVRYPPRDDDSEKREACDSERGGNRQPVFQPEPCTKLLEETILFADEVDAECTRGKSGSARLHSDQNQQAADDLRMDVQVATEH